MSLIDQADVLAPGAIERLALLSDFGRELYIGQVRARLHAALPSLAMIDLVQDLPVFRPDLAARLLPALVRDMPPATLYLCVVDPGVGGSRAALLAAVDGDWFIAPDNGLLAPLLARAHHARVWRVGWRPEHCSASFHGRDLFAPVVARLVGGEDLSLAAQDETGLVGADWPVECAAILYRDRFGNLMTGLQPPAARHTALLTAGPYLLSYARTFCEVPEGRAFWYENALGLVEIAANRADAGALLRLVVGDAIGPFVAA